MMLGLMRRSQVPPRPAKATVSCPVEAIEFEMHMYHGLMISREDSAPEDAQDYAELCDWVLARIRSIWEGLTDGEQAGVAAFLADCERAALQAGAET